MKTPLVGAVSLAVGGLPRVWGQAAGKPITRALGNTGITLPVISMGVMNAEAPGLIRRAYEVGVRHFDTAHGYQGGRNEQMVGAVIKELGVRKQVTISTKIRAGTVDGYVRDLETSLERLQMDYVDILYCHGARETEQLHAPELIEAFTRFKKEGKARFVGFSTHSNQAALLTEAANMQFFDVILTAYNFTMAGDKALDEAIGRAANKGIGLIAMKTQANAHHLRDSGTEKPEGPERQTAALKWALRTDRITTAIPGFTAFEHVDKDFAVASDLSLTEKERLLLADKATVAEIGFCQQCGQCQGCRNQADIPALMRVHMYAAGYGNWDQARAAYGEIAAGSDLSACESCDACSARCVNSVRIPSRIAELKTRLRQGLMV